MCNRALVGKTAGERLRGTRGGWMDSIKMDLQEIEWEGVDWIHLA
jgi:hypothetical protein